MTLLEDEEGNSSNVFAKLICQIKETPQKQFSLQDIAKVIMSEGGNQGLEQHRI